MPSTWKTWFFYYVLVLVLGLIYLPPQLQLLIPLLLLLPPLYLLRRPNFLGPLFLYDLVRTARQNRHIPIRALYAAALLAMLFFHYSNFFPGVKTVSQLFKQERLSLSDLPRFADNFFSAFLTAQFTAVFLLTPAYIAGAIAEERERRTLEFLFTTGLTDREIVLGTLFARLANLVLLVLAGLPVLCLTFFLGGVDPGQVVFGFLATFMTMLSLGSLSILISVHAKKSHVAILGTYGLVVGYVIGSACVPGLNWGNPLVILVSMEGLLHHGQLAGPGMVSAYMLFHGAVAFFCLAMAVGQLRQVGQDVAPALPAPDPLSDQDWGRYTDQGPLLTLTRIPRVGELPLLWKEIHVEQRMSPLVILLNVLLCIILVLTVITGLSVANDDKNDWKIMSGGWICLALMAIPYAAAGAITREREQHTLDTLLSTPVERDDILYAKWLSCVWLTRWPWVCFAATLPLAVLAGKLHVFSYLLLLTAWFVFAAFFASLGLLCSVLSGTTLRATLLAIIAALGCCVVTWSLTYEDVRYRWQSGWPSQSLEDWATRFYAYGLPPSRALGALAFSLGDLEGTDLGTRQNLQVALGGVLLYALAAFLLWQLARLLFHRQTISTVLSASPVAKGHGK